MGTDRMNLLDDRGPGPMGPTRIAMSKPVIAAVEGYAVAGGLELALWCDLRVAADTAAFGVFCRRWGVPLIDGGTVRLQRVVGQGHAMDMILTGREVSATEARSMGLVNRIVPEGQARMSAENLARELSRFPQMCMRNDRRSVIEAWGSSLDDAMHREFALGLATIDSGETEEGAARFRDGERRN
jgi:enoyl-CoA hydratase